MKKLVIVIALAGAPLMLAAPGAEAHDRYAKHEHYAQGHYRGHMPRWLRKHHGFNAWYRYSGLRANVRLGWDELFSIYRWELRFSNHRRAHRYDRGHDHDYRYYRRYWDDRRYDRDRYRYGDRKRGKYKDHGKKRDKRRHH